MPLSTPFRLLLLIAGLLALLAVIACSEPSPEEQATPGLGVSVNDIEDMFDEYDLDVDTESAPLKDGTPRWFVETPHELATVELIGNKSDLQQVSLSMVMDGSNGDILTAYTLLILSGIFPDWDNSLNWLADSLPRFDNNPGAVIETTRGNAKVSLKFFKSLSTVSLTIKAE